MRARFVHHAPVLALLALAGLAACSPNDTSTGNAAATPAAIPATGSVGAAVQPGDQALTCSQISTEIAQNNAIIQGANAAGANGASSSGNSGDNGVMNGGEASTVPTPEQLRARRAQRAAAENGPAAMARANTLVQLGKAKKCFS